VTPSRVTLARVTLARVTLSGKTVFAAPVARRGQVSRPAQLSDTARFDVRPQPLVDVAPFRPVRAGRGTGRPRGEAAEKKGGERKTRGKQAAVCAGQSGPYGTELPITVGGRALQNGQAHPGDASAAEQILGGPAHTPLPGSPSVQNDMVLGRPPLLPAGEGRPPGLPGLQSCPGLRGYPASAAISASREASPGSLRGRGPGESAHGENRLLPPDARRVFRAARI
jgi:hypothetical protein